MAGLKAAGNLCWCAFPKCVSIMKRKAYPGYCIAGSVKINSEVSESMLAGLLTHKLSEAEL